MKSIKGITLVALVITIVVLLILSAVTISLTLGERGVFNLAEEAGSESKKAEATEKVNLKITQAQMKSYIENQRLPSLQELADIFNIDNDFEYVHTSKKELAAVVEPFSIGDSSSIFVKLEDYTYEFEIDSSLRLASIDGVRLANVETSGGSDEVTGINEIVYEIGINNKEKGVETIQIEHDNSNAAIFTGQQSLKYKINSEENYNSLSLLGGESNKCGFYYAFLSVKKGDIVYIQRDTIGEFGYVIVY